MRQKTMTEYIKTDENRMTDQNREIESIEKETRAYKTASRHIVQIGRAKFDYVTQNMLTYNGHTIEVNITHYPMFIDFIDFITLKDILSPEDYISINRLYKFDKNLLIESENFIFIPDASLNTIRMRVLEFIEKEGGKYTYIDKDDEEDKFIMCTFSTMIVCFNFVPIKGGYIVEIEKTIKFINYSIQYYNMVKRFIKTFS
jgi:hypothetical protein